MRSADDTLSKNPEGRRRAVSNDPSAALKTDGSEPQPQHMKYL